MRPDIYRISGWDAICAETLLVGKVSYNSLTEKGNVLFDAL